MFFHVTEQIHFSDEDEKGMKVRSDALSNCGVQCGGDYREPDHWWLPDHCFSWIEEIIWEEIQNCEMDDKEERDKEEEEYNSLRSCCILWSTPEFSFIFIIYFLVSFDINAIKSLCICLCQKGFKTDCNCFF